MELIFVVFCVVGMIICMPGEGKASKIIGWLVILGLLFAILVGTFFLPEI